MDTSTATIPAARRWMSHVPVWARVLIIIVVVVAIGVAVMIRRMNSVPTDLNLGLTRESAQGIFQSTYSAKLQPLAINQIHEWKLHIEMPDGTAVENAQITVDGGMPQHGHGLPTVPQVTEYLGNGDYRVEGMKFNMPGWWVVEFEIASGGQTDKVAFNLILE